ncbi:Hypothetical protein, putative [Bodo saltans]|uniref:Uncharacterized protein n=1 Tax=Bodo saltans TaxID=75058 RepID=A0A0S4KEC3_BODSA|nr:Hypothetical protein, putative [Bodo saltans]|eukprot:CUI12392.1 Hypothetical protein, putative [Bodo saltans]
MTPTYIYRFPTPTTTSSSTKQQDRAATCIPLDLIVTAHREVIPYASTRTSSFETVRFQCRPSLDEFHGDKADGLFGGGSRVVALSCTITGTEASDLQRIVSAVCPMIPWESSGSLQSRAQADGPVLWNPTTVVYPLATYADVALRESTDERCELLADRLKTIAEVFHVQSQGGPAASPTESAFFFWTFNGIVSAVCPMITWESSGSLQSRAQADGPVLWNPKTVVFPLTTYADVALRESTDERCELLADRLKAIAEVFHVQSQGGPAAPPTESASSSLDHWTATCRSDIFTSCVLDARGRLTPTSNAPSVIANDWATTKDRLQQQAKSMEQELVYLRTQVELLTNHSYTHGGDRQSAAAVNDSSSLDSARHEAISEAVMALAAPSAARDRCVASIKQEFERHHAISDQLEQIRKSIAWSADMPHPQALQQHISLVQEQMLVLESTIHRNIINGRTSSQVSASLETLGVSVRKLQKLAGRETQASELTVTGGDRGMTSSGARGTQRALEESLRVISQHRQAEMELASALDEARVALLRSQIQTGVKAACFVRWCTWATRRRAARLQQAAADDASQNATTRLVETEASALRAKLHQREEEMHAIAAGVAAERAKLHAAMDDERRTLKEQTAESERRCSLLKEHITELERAAIEHSRRVSELESRLTLSERQSLDSAEAQRKTLLSEHEAQLESLQAEIRGLHGRLRDADATIKLEASKWEERLETERLESGARKRADIASTRAAVEDELNAYHQRSIAAQRQRDAAVSQVSSLQSDIQQLHEQMSELRNRSMTREKESVAQHEAEVLDVTKRWSQEVDQLRNEQRRIRASLDEAVATAAAAARSHKEELVALQAEHAGALLQTKLEYDQKEVTMRQLRHDIAELNANQASLANSLERERFLTEQSRTEVQQLRRQLSELNETHAASLSQLATLERTSSSLSLGAQQAADKHADELSRHASEQRAQLQDALRESDRRQLALDAASKDITQLSLALSTAQADLRKYMAEAAGALEVVRDLEEELSVVHAARLEAAAALPEEQARHERDLGQLASRLHALQEEHAQCALEREQLLAQHEQASQVAAAKLQRRAQAAEEREAALQREVENRDGRLHEALFERQNLHQELRESSLALKESQAKEAQLRRTLSNKESEWEQQFHEQKRATSTQEALFASLTEQLKNLEAQLSATTTSRDGLRSQLTRLEEEHHRLQRLTDSLKSTASQKEMDLIRVADAERSRLKTLHEHELKDAHAEIAKALQQVEAATSRAAHVTHESKTRQDNLNKQYQKLTAEVAEAKQQQKQAQSESVAQGEMLKDMETELAGVHMLLRDKVHELQAAEESLYRLEQEREDWERRMQRLHNERLRTESSSKEELQQLQTALLTLSQESELREHQLTEALERMTSHSTEDRSHERQQYEQRVFALQAESEALRVDRDELAKKRAASDRHVNELELSLQSTQERIRRLETLLDEKSQLASRLDPAMQLASELERELALQFKKEKALTSAMEEAAQRIVALHEENRMLQLQLERSKQDHASLMIGNDSALTTVRSERGKLMTVHDEELRIERERVRRMERERDDWNSERLELQRDYEGKLQRSYELEKSRIAELSASWEVEREKIRRDHDAQLDIIRRGCQTAERRADNLLTELDHKNEVLLGKEKHIESLEQHLRDAAAEAKEQEAVAAYRLNAALEVLNDVEVEASFHERSIVSTTEEMSSLKATLANLGDVERRLQEARAEGQALMTVKFRLEEDLSERAIQHERVTAMLKRANEDLASLRARYEGAQLENERFVVQLASQAQHIRDIAEANNKLGEESKELAARRTDTEAKWDSRVAALAVEREQMRAMHDEQVATLNQTIRSLETRQGSLRDENDALCKQLATDESLISTLRGEVEEAERSLVRLHKQLQMQEQELTNAHDELAKIDFLPRGALSERPTAADTVRLLSEDLRQLLLEKRKAADREELLVRQLRELQNTHLTENDQNVAMCLDVIAGLESDIAELHRERDSLTNELVVVRTERNSAVSITQSLKDDLAAVQDQLMEVQSLNAELEDEAEAAIEESQQLALKMEELDVAMHRAAEEHHQEVEEVHTSRQTTLKSLEGHMEGMIQYAKSIESKHREELDELQHQLDCAEAVFQGLNVSLADKTARLEFATKQLDTLKEEHLQELKRVRERYAISLRERVETSMQTTNVGDDEFSDIIAPRGVTPRAGSGDRSTNRSPHHVTRNLVLPTMDEMLRSPAIQAALQEEERQRTGAIKPATSSSAATAASHTHHVAAHERAQQLSEQLAIERMNSQLAADELEVLTRTNAQLKRELSSIHDQNKTSSVDAAKRAVELDELRFENDMLKRRHERMIEDYDRERKSLMEQHEAAAQRLAANHDEQTKRLLARLIETDEALNSAHSDRSQYKEKLKLILEETAHTVTMLTETELSAKSREAELELSIRNMQAKLSGREMELEVQQSVVAHLKATQDSAMADSQERLKNVASALHSARLETETFRQKIIEADRQIVRTLQEVQVLTDEYEQLTMERDQLSGRLAEEDATHQRTVEALAECNAAFETMKADRDALFRIVTEAAETSTAIAEERDHIASEYDSFLRRPRVSNGTQTVDAFRTSTSTQHDAKMIVHCAIQCMPNTTNAFSATDITAARDIGVETSADLLDNRSPTGVRSEDATPVLRDKSAQGVNTGTSTEANIVVAASTQTASPQHMSVSTQRILWSTTSTLTDAPPALRSVATGEPLEDATRNKHVQTMDDWFLRPDYTTSASQTPASPELHLASTQTTQVVGDTLNVTSTTQTPSAPELHPAATQTPVSAVAVTRGSQCSSPMSAANGTQTVVEVTTRGSDASEDRQESYGGLEFSFSTMRSSPLFGGQRSPEKFNVSDVAREEERRHVDIDDALPPPALTIIAPPVALQPIAASTTAGKQVTERPSPSTTVTTSPRSIPQRYSPRAHSSVALAKLRHEREIDDVIIAEPMGRATVISEELAARRLLHQQATDDVVVATGAAVQRAAEEVAAVQASLTDTETAQHTASPVIETSNAHVKDTSVEARVENTTTEVVAVDPPTTALPLATTTETNGGSSVQLPSLMTSDRSVLPMTKCDQSVTIEASSHGTQLRDQCLAEDDVQSIPSVTTASVPPEQSTEVHFDNFDQAPSVQTSEPLRNIVVPAQHRDAELPATTLVLSPAIALPLAAVAQEVVELNKPQEPAGAVAPPTTASEGLSGNSHAAIDAQVDQLEVHGQQVLPKLVATSPLDTITSPPLQPEGVSMKEEPAATQLQATAEKTSVEGEKAASATIIEPASTRSAEEPTTAHMLPATSSSTSSLPVVFPNVAPDTRHANTNPTEGSVVPDVSFNVSTPMRPTLVDPVQVVSARTPRTPRRQVSAELHRLRQEKLIDEILIEEPLVRSTVIMSEVGERRALMESMTVSHLSISNTEVLVAASYESTSTPTPQDNSLTVPIVARSNITDLVVPPEPSIPPIAERNGAPVYEYVDKDLFAVTADAPDVPTPKEKLDQAGVGKHDTHTDDTQVDVLVTATQHGTLHDTPRTTLPSDSRVQQQLDRPSEAMPSHHQDPSSDDEGNTTKAASEPLSTEYTSSFPDVPVVSAPEEDVPAAQLAPSTTEPQIERDSSAGFIKGAVVVTTTAPSPFKTQLPPIPAAPAQRASRSPRRDVASQLERLHTEKLLDEVVLQEPIDRVSVASSEVKERRLVFASFVCDQPRPQASLAPPPPLNASNLVDDVSAHHHATTSLSPEHECVVTSGGGKRLPPALETPQPVFQSPAAVLPPRRSVDGTSPTAASTSKRRAASSSRTMLFEMQLEQDRADVMDAAAIDHAVILNQEASLWRVVVEMRNRDAEVAATNTVEREARANIVLRPPTPDVYDHEHHYADHTLASPEGLSPIREDNTLIIEDLRGADAQHHHDATYHAPPAPLVLISPQRSPDGLAPRPTAQEDPLETVSPPYQEDTSNEEHPLHQPSNSGSNLHAPFGDTLNRLPSHHTPFGETINGRDAAGPLGVDTTASSRTSSLPSTQRSLSPPQHHVVVDDQLAAPSFEFETNAAPPSRLTDEQRIALTKDDADHTQKSSPMSSDDSTHYFEEESPHHHHGHHPLGGTTMDTMFHDETADESLMFLQQDAPEAPQGPATLGQTTPTRYPGMSSTPPPLLSAKSSFVAPHPQHVHDDPLPPSHQRHAMIDAIDDYEMCVMFADGMELIEEDEFFEWTDIVQLEEAERLQVYERAAMLHAAETEGQRRFARVENNADAAMNHRASPSAQPTETELMMERLLEGGSQRVTATMVEEVLAAEESMRHADVDEVMTLQTTTVEALMASSLLSSQGTQQQQHTLPPPAPSTIKGKSFPSRHEMRQAAAAPTARGHGYVPPTASASPSNASHRSASNNSQQYVTGGGSHTPARHRSPGASSTASRMAPYFVAGRNTMVLQQTPIKKSAGARLSSDHIAEVLATMTSERNEAMETTARVQTIASLMAKSRQKR